MVGLYIMDFDIIESKKDPVLQDFWKYWDEQSYASSCRWLLSSGVPQQTKIWAVIATSLREKNTLLYQIAIWYGNRLPDPELDTNLMRQEIVDNLPSIPQSKITDAMVTLPKTISDFWWQLPFRLKRRSQQDTALINDWCDQHASTLSFYVLKHFFSHIQEQDWLSFFAGLYLWSRTFGTMDQVLVQAMFRWLSIVEPQAGYEKSTNAVLAQWVSYNQKVAFADEYAVAIYDLMNFAYREEIDPELITRNRNQAATTKTQSLYSILPIFDDFGTEAREKRMTQLNAVIQQYPDFIWAHATLLFLAGDANYIDPIFENSINHVYTTLKQKIKDPLIAVFDTNIETRIEALQSLPNSNPKIQELHRLDPKNIQYHSMLMFTFGIIPSTENSPFEIRYQESPKIENVKEGPSWILIFSCTIIAFTLGIWVMTTLLQTLW